MKRWHWLVIVAAMMLGLTAMGFAQEAAPPPPEAVAPAEAAAAAEPAAEPFVDRLWQAQGLMHPVVVHFPIAMIIGAAIAVLLRPIFRRITPGVVYYCLLIGAMGAVVSSLAGWAWAPARGYGDMWDAEGELFWHRWGGVIVTITAIVISLWATQRVRKPESKQIGWQLGVVVLAAMIGLVGHQGGELVYPNNLEKFWATLMGERKVTPPPQLPAESPAPESPPVAQASPAAPEDGKQVPEPNSPVKTVSDASSAATPDHIDFTTQVWPILQAKCVDCHGPDKGKGKFRLHTQEAALAGGSSDEPGYVAGNPTQSLIIRLITAEDELDRMPPVDEGEPITPAELAVLVKWIEQGATWGATPGAAAGEAAAARPQSSRERTGG